MKVRVYWNLHRRKWSIQQDGLVIGHKESVNLTDASFVVRRKGQERVRREGTKNVHAFAFGYMTDKEQWQPNDPIWCRVKYDPIMDDFFKKQMMFDSHAEWEDISRDWIGDITMQTLLNTPKVYI